MALNKDIAGKVKLASTETSYCYLEVSVDNGENFVIVDSMVVPPNETPNIYSFPNLASVDIDNPNLIIKIRVQTGNTTTTTTSSSTSTTSSTTTSSSSTTTTSTTNAPGREFLLEPDAFGRVEINNNSNTYLPGDIFILEGEYKVVYFTNFTGTAENPYRVKNADGQLAKIGDESWTGGSWSTAMFFDNCHHFILGSEDGNRNNFLFSGSTDPVARNAYFNLVLRNHTDNFEIRNIKIQNGGTGIWAKTDPVEGDPTTWYPNTYMYNLRIHDVEIYNTNNENMYIGHTATWWNLTRNIPYYGVYGDTSNPDWHEGEHYEQPIKWNDVRIYNNLCHDGFADGIQTAAIDNLFIYNNEVYNWARGHNGAHNGGILIGGRVKNFEAYCNYVHDGWGELLQCYADGADGAYGRVYNNLLLNSTANDGAIFRVTNNLAIEFYDNTVAYTAGNLTRFYFGTDHIVERNILINPETDGGTIYPNRYIYLEPGAAVIEGSGPNANGKYPVVEDANVDVNNWYLPNPGSPAINWGFRKSLCGFGTSTTTTSSSSSSTTTTSTSSSTTTTTTTILPTTTTTTTIGSQGTFVKISNWKTDTPNQYGWIYTPPGYNAGDTKKYSFIVFLHGQGEVGSGSTSANLLVDPSRGGPGKYLNSGDSPQDVVIFIPQLASSPGTWEPSWVEPARQFVITNYNGDVNKFYLTGLSLGGSGTSKYVMTYPDRVAAYLVAIGDTQYQRDANTAATVNGVRQVDVPGWFHGGIADSTISVNNGIGAMSDMNNMSPRPIYPYLVDTYWGLGHSNSMWDDKIYNRKNRTDATGTAIFDYIEWFKKFKSNDIIFNSDSHIKIAESTNDYTDYLVALRLTNKISDTTTKNAYLARLSVVKSNIDSDNKILLLNFGAGTAVGNMNIINISNGASVNNMIDINGGTTSIGFALSGSQWNPPDVAIEDSFNQFHNEYFGFNESLFTRGFRVYNNATWTITGLNNTKKYKLRFFYGDLSENTSTNSGGNISINGVVKSSANAKVNTTKFVDYDQISPTSGQIVCTMTSLQNNWQCDYTGMLIYESINSTPTTSTSSTTTTSSSTSTTSSTTSTTTTLSSSTTTSTSSSTTTTTTSTTSSTTTTTTTLSPTTTTTTTVAGTGAKFRFSPDLTYTTAGWADMVGNQQTQDITATQNGITCTNVKTAWQNAGSISGDVDGGMSTGTFDIFPASVVRGNWLNYDIPWYGPASYGIILSGLNTAKSYDVKIIGSIKSSLEPSNTTIYRLVGNGDEASPIQQTLNNVDNTNNYVTYSNIIPNASGEIKISVNQSFEFGNIGYIGGLIITEVVNIAKFNFNNTAQNISGWKDVSGSPDAGVITATDTATGITVSSIAGKWGAFGGTSNNTNGGTGVNADFPTNVMVSYWYNYSLTYPSFGSNLKLSNLTPSTSYRIKMIGSRSSTAGAGIPAGQNRIMEFSVSQVGTISDASEQANISYAARDSVTTQTFTITSNASGEIYIGVFPSRDGNGTNGDQLGFINGLIVEKL